MLRVSFLLIRISKMFLTKAVKAPSHFTSPSGSPSLPRQVSRKSSFNILATETQQTPPIKGIFCFRLSFTGFLHVVKRKYKRINSSVTGKKAGNDVTACIAEIFLTQSSKATQ